MSRVCGVAGCPVLIESLPNIYYCEEHTEKHFETHDNLEGEYADEVDGVLDNWLLMAADTSGRNDEDVKWAKYIGEQLQEHIPAVRGAAHAMEPWTAVRHALWVGLMAGYRLMPERGTRARQEPQVWFSQRYSDAQAKRRLDYCKWIEVKHQAIRDDLAARLAKEPDTSKRKHLQAMQPLNQLTLAALYRITKGVK